MPINLQYNAGARKAENPAIFWYHSPNEKKKAFLSFMRQVKNASRYFMTEDPEMGKKYIDNNKHLASVEFLETTASKEMEEALGFAMEAMNRTEVMDMLLSSVVPEPGSTIPHTNALFVVNPLEELEVDLNQFKGRVNARPVNLYKHFTEGLKENDIELVKDQIHIPWEGDTLYLAPHAKDAWQAVVDEEVFLEKLEKRLEQTKTA